MCCSERLSDGAARRISLRNPAGHTAQSKSPSSAHSNCCSNFRSASACGDNSSSWTPYVLSLDPPVLDTGTTNVSVYGERFAPGAIMYWNGRRQATTFSSDRRLDVQLDIGATSTRGTGTVTVNNEGSYSSNEIKITVQDAPLKATSLSPPAVPVGAAAAPAACRRPRR